METIELRESDKRRAVNLNRKNGSAEISGW